MSEPLDPRRHLAAMQYLADCIKPLFPSNEVEFHWGSPTNFFAMWPLRDQPAELTQTSRTVSIHFSDQFLGLILKLDEADRKPHVDELREIVQRRLVGFDDGRATRRGGVKDALVIDVTLDLGI